jgi:shikimate 5-dehydrogenase
MLVHQAAKSFELWTGEKIPVDELQKSLLMVIKN